MSDFYAKFYPKPRKGNECKKTKCSRYEAYYNWFGNLGGSGLKFCMECKNAHVSQYEASKG